MTGHLKIMNEEATLKTNMVEPAHAVFSLYGHPRPYKFPNASYLYIAKSSPP